MKDGEKPPGRMSLGLLRVLFVQLIALSLAVVYVHQKKLDPHIELMRPFGGVGLLPVDILLLRHFGQFALNATVLMSGAFLWTLWKPASTRTVLQYCAALYLIFLVGYACYFTLMMGAFIQSLARQPQ